MPCSTVSTGRGARRQTTSDADCRDEGRATSFVKPRSSCSTIPTGEPADTVGRDLDGRRHLAATAVVRTGVGPRPFVLTGPARRGYVASQSHGVARVSGWITSGMCQAWSLGHSWWIMSRARRSRKSAAVAVLARIVAAIVAAHGGDDWPRYAPWSKVRPSPCPVSLSLGRVDRPWCCRRRYRPPAVSRMYPELLAD